jgi:hypothetical protein
MHNGDTIQKLAAAVDTLHERRSGNAVKTVFTNTPKPAADNEASHERLLTLNNPKAAEDAATPVQ